MFFNNSEKLKYYDLIVVGNNLNAVVSAGMAAKNGKTVALVTESELLFSEYSESLLGFIKKDSNLFNMLVDMGVAPINIGNEYHIPAGMASKAALRFLKENNVDLFLKAAPIGLLKNKEKVLGIAIATKFGAYALKGSFVADFSDRKFYNNKNNKSDCLYAIQMGGIDFNKVKLPHALDTDLTDIFNITLHGDCRSLDTGVITFETNENQAHMAIEKAIKLICYLKKSNPSFALSGLLKFSLRPAPLEVSYNTPQKNLLQFKSGNILAEDDYYNAITFVTDLINNFLENSVYNEPEFLETTYGLFDLAPLYCNEELDAYLGAELLKIKIPTGNAPTKKSALFIAGLGAGGAAAMKAALDSGCNAIGAEALPVPAGTRGQGMVSAFWHGYQKGFAAENLAEVKAFSKANLGESAPFYTAETIYDIYFMKNTAVFYNSIVFDALKRGDNTVGALLATPDGIVKIESEKCIDATGDADLAALAGVEYSQNGDYRDKVTQGYSVWGEEKVGTPFKDSLYKSDEDSISTEKYSEFLRGIYSAHLKQSDYGFSALLTVRESRRIKGKYSLNMKDIMRGEVFDDTISLSLCKYDAHGNGSSPAYHTALFNALRSKELPDVITRIPLRALLPEKDNGLMVISKAISATRDAGCLIRMNPDIQNTGYAAGLVAANSAKNCLSFEAAFTNDIKNLLLEKELLPDYYNKKTNLDPAELLEKVCSGDIAARATASACPQNLTYFEAAYDGDKNLALVLSALGSEKPFDDILCELKELIKKYKAYASADSDSSKYTDTLIEKNKAMRSTADKIKSHSILLSRIAANDNSKKSEFLPVLCEAIDIMNAGGGYGNPANGIYQNSKVSNRIVPNYKAILGVVIAAESVADKSLAAPLMALGKKQNIRLLDGSEIHSVQLYLRIIAAAARCGDKTAKKELEEYVSCERAFFREFAKSELDTLGCAKSDVLPVEIAEFWI